MYIRKAKIIKKMWKNIKNILYFFLQCFFFFSSHCFSFLYFFCYLPKIDNFSADAVLILFYPTEKQIIHRTDE